jgi:hypothetical protein
MWLATVFGNLLRVPGLSSGHIAEIEVVFASRVFHRAASHLGFCCWPLGIPFEE